MHVRVRAASCVSSRRSYVGAPWRAHRRLELIPRVPHRRRHRRFEFVPCIPHRRPRVRSSSRRVTGVHASPSVLTSSCVLDDSRAGVRIGDVCTAVRAPRLTAPMPAFSGESGALILSIMSSSLRCLSSSACLLRCSNGDTDLRCGAGGDAVGSVLGAVKPSVKLRRRPLAPGICPAF